MKKLLTLVLVLFTMSEILFATSANNYLLDSIVHIDESTGFVDSKKIYEYHKNGTLHTSVNLRATWSSWKVGVPKILNSKTTLVYDEEGHELDYFSSVLDTATGIWKDTHHYLYDERHNRVCGVRKWNSDSTVVLQGSHYYYDEDNFQIGSDQFDTWNGVQVLDYKCENIKDAHGNKIIMVEYSKPESAWDGDYMSDPNAFNETGWVRIDSVFYSYNEKQEKTRETIYRWNNDTQEWTMDGYQIFEYDEEGHCIADTVFARDFETNVITYNNMTANTYDSHGKLSRIQMYMPNFTENGVKWIENGKYAYDYTYDENGEILQLRDYIDWQTGSSSTTYYTSTYFYSKHPAQDEPETCIFASGTCGGDLTWELTCDSVLTIKGTGMMYEYSDWNSPWRPYKDSIKSVIIEEGVTTISTAAFRDHGHLQSCILPSTIESIGNEAFCFCFQLMYIEIPPSCTAFGDGSFNLVPNVIIQDESILPYSGSARSLNGYVDGLFVYDNSEKRSLRACSSAAKGEITLDDAIERIEYMAFAQCEDITHINFGSNLKYIGEWSLDGCRELDGLQFQEGLTEIATHGFGNCFGLRYVSLPNSLTTLGDFAIGNCPDLRVIRLGDSLKYVGYQIFDYCQSIDTIYASMPTPPVLDETAFASTDLSNVICIVPNQSVSLYKNALVWKQMNIKSIDNPEPCTIASGSCGDNLTWKLTCDSTLTIEGSGDMTSWTSVTHVPWYKYHSYVKHISLLNGVTSIGRMAFYFFGNLTSIDIPNSITSIEGLSFSECGSLTSILIPNSVINIGSEYCFMGCKSLNSIIVTEDNPQYCSIDGVLFTKELTKLVQYPQGKSDVSNYLIPYGVEYIEQYAFAHNVSLESISIPSTVVEIANLNPFTGCNNLSTIIVDYDNPVFDSRNNCNAIIKTESNSLVVGCKNTIVDNSIKRIEDLAFQSIRTLSSINIPEGVIEIGRSAFNCCTNLHDITLPNSIIEIGQYAFSQCDSLTNINLPELLIRINSCTFQGCYMIKNIVIPKDVTSIEKYAFTGCRGLTSISCNSENPPTLDYNVFNGVDKSIPLYVPSASIHLYREAEQWSDFTNILPLWNPEGPVNPGNYELRLLVNEETMGNVTGEGLYAQGTEVTITAIPVEGCRFVRWSDGNTDAERNITLMVDTTFTAYFEPISITLNLEAATEQITGRWFAFGVPFDVAVSTGIFIVGTDDPAMCNYDFVIDEYDGALRASTQNGWKRVATNDTLRPGRFYMIAPKTAREWRFEAANPGEFSEENSVSINAYPSPYGERHSGWNGIANPQWAATTAEIDGVTFATVYNNYYGVYSTELLCEKEWSRAEPFFVQTPNDGEVVFYAENIPSPSAAPMRMELSSDKNVSYTLELSDVSFNYTDKAYISAFEGKENRYKIGRDLEKMQVNNAVVPQLWLEAYGTRLAAYEVPIVKEETYIPIGLYAPQEGTYALTVNDVPEDATIYLTKDGQPIWNVSDGTYALTLEKGDNEGYGLSVNSNKMPTGINSLEASDDIRKMLIDGQILILRGEKVYTVTGQEIR